MKYAVAVAALVAAVSAQSCQDSVSYSFQISPVNVSESTGAAKRDSLHKRVAECTKTPIVTLQGGVLTDQSGRTGEIVSNHQLQFDQPLQPGNLFHGGFCINSNSTLSIGGSAIFYSCISGDFSNLYNADIGSVCSQVWLDAVECVGGVSSGSATLSASTSTQSSSASSASLATTPATTAATTSAPAPYPAGNATTPAGSASVAPSATTTTTSGHSTTSPATYQPSSGANVLTLGGQLLAGVAAIGMFALF